ncbi:hypothetical protein TH61_15675 [Rufibacter sp. DG15C]|uniref:T9SS type A sorting domain-containing protein n=1 Tax=Rufibacter sp. DG15C TaxID=1379909 RepID=UPI00078B55BA|nr:T9SS type A sorting domain-containing protein [Rufibacter sp. DG15C]AMM52339.1 hypothetical protein TH61_15675 [Rufibacter sp. DG15C]
MKLKPTFTSVFLGLLALGGLSSSLAMAQKKKKATAQEKTSVHMFKEHNGKLVEVDTLETLTPEQLAKHKRFSEVYTKNPEAFKHMMIRPSTLEAGKALRGQMWLSEDSTKERTVKLKIVKKEGEQYFALDTTLVIPAGVSQRTAVKNLNLDSRSMKSLGAKPIASTGMEGAGIFDKVRVLPLHGNDSLRTLLFKSISSDSVLKLADGQVLVRGKSIEKWVTSLDEKGVPQKGHTFYLRKSLSGDSLLHGRIMLHADSLLQMHGDSAFRLRDFSVFKDSTGGVRVFRIKTNGAEKEGARFQGFSPGDGERHQIIILRSTKEEGSKKRLKAKSSKESKTGNDLKVTLYPNPSSGRFTVSFQIDKKSETKLRVVDSTGRTVLEEDAGMQKGMFTRELDLSRFGRGVYILQILSGKNVRSERVVVQ